MNDIYNNQPLGPEAARLGWLLGQWRGWGVWSGFGVENVVLLHDLEVAHDGGPYLRLLSHYLRAEAASGTISADASAADGIAALAETDVWSQETLYLRVNPSQAGSGSADVVGVEGMLADPAGYTVALEGRLAPHMIALASEQISRVASCPQVTQLERRYLLRDDELMISAQMAAFDQPLTPYLTTRLIKAEAAAGAPALGAEL